LSWLGVSRYIADAMAGWIVKYDGPCSKCGTLLRAGTAATYDRARRQMSCLECPTNQAIAPTAQAIDTGIAGGSAGKEYARLQERREAALKGRWGDRIGGLINRFADEPQSIRAWGIGTEGERLLGAALATVPGLIVLNDRRVPGTKGNIDHILVASAGVFVVDAKHYGGTIEVVDRGGLFRTDRRLTVGGRDRSQLAEKMDWQVKAVIRALTDAELTPLPQITAVLCFVDGNWPIFRQPKSFNGVLLESDRSIVKRLTATSELSESEIDRIARVLGDALPAK
jgi:hypothetical protein